MTLKEQLAAKQAELVALKSRIEADDADAIAEGESLAKEIDELNSRIAQAAAKGSLLDRMSAPAPVAVKTARKPRSLGAALVSEMKGISKGSRFSVEASYMTKDGDDPTPDPDPEPEPEPGIEPITALSFDTVNRAVPLLPGRTPVASLMGAYNITGDTYTFLKKNPFTGEIEKVDEGGKKPFVKTSYKKETVTIEKIAAYTKYTTETAWDNAFLTSAINGELLYELGRKEDASIISDVLADEGIVDDITYDASEDLGMVEAIMKARAAIAENTAYTADAVIINPSDFVDMMLAKDSNNNYYGRNFFGGSPDQPTIWGMPVFQSAHITAGTVLVGAFKNAVKVVRNQGVMSAATNTNEDDFINNLVTVLVEERFATAVEVPEAIYVIEAGE